MSGTHVSWNREDGSSVPGLFFGKEGAHGGVIVIQEWWGVDNETVVKAEKLANAGFAVLIPDLYRGALALNAQEASHLMNNLDFKGAIADIRGAAHWLTAHGAKRVGAIGYCMGGALALGAVIQESSIVCAVPYYGFNAHLGDPTTLPQGKAVQAHFGRNDHSKGFSDVETAEKLRAMLAASPASAACDVIVHDGVGHGFMNSTPDGIARKLANGHGEHNQAIVDAAWASTLAFLHAHLIA